MFDEQDIRARVDDLAGFLGNAEAEYGIAPGSAVAVGFSNGANIASALLFQYPESLAGAVLLAVMVPFREPPQVDLTGKRVAVVNGKGDPMVTPAHTEKLVSQLRDAGAEVAVLDHDGGHTVDPRTLPRVWEFLRGAKPDEPIDA